MNKRVGTISMGLVLIFFGVIMLITQINGNHAVELFMKFWPIILIFLGIEILFYVYKNNTGEGKIQYDIFSIFIVIIILFVNIAIYGLMETGIMDLIKLRVDQEIEYYQD